MGAKTEAKLINKNSLKFLEDAKKGKVRRFVMIHKGVNILSLIVYKKGSIEKYKKEAMAIGKGEFSHGVIAGKGVNLQFQLARADGFEEAPTKNLALKKFLTDNTDEKFKPEYEIVDTLQLVLDDDEPLVAKPAVAEPPIAKLTDAKLTDAKLTDAKPAAEPVKATPQPQKEATLQPESENKSNEPAVVEDSADQAAPAEPVVDYQTQKQELIEKVKQYQPTLDAACQAFPEEEVDLRDYSTEIDSAISAGDLETAESFFNNLQEAIVDLGPIPEPNAEGPTDRTALQLEFETVLKELAPQAMPIAKGSGSSAADMAALLKGVQVDRQANNFENGLEKLKQIRQLLDTPAEIPQAPPVPEAVDPVKKQKFREALVKIVPPVQRTLRSADVPDMVKAELKGLVTQLKEDVANNQFDQARAAVAHIVPIIKEHAPPAEQKSQPKSGGAVDYGKARLVWDSAHKKASAELQKLKKAMLAECDNDPDEFESYRDAVLAMDEILAPFDNELPDLLDRALNAEDPSQRQQLHNRAAQLIQNNIEALEGNEFFKAVDANPVHAVPVYSTLANSLNVLASTIS